MGTHWWHSLRMVCMPCLGFYLLGSVKQIAIANSFVAVSSMVIFGAGIYEFLPRRKTDKDGDDSFQQRIRPVFWAFYYLYWIAEIYLSLFIHLAAHHRDHIKCRRWLKVQVICYLAFIAFFIAHSFWLHGFNVILEACFGIICLYKLYTFWVVNCFINETIEINNKYKFLRDLPDEDVDAFLKGHPVGTRSSFSFLDSNAIQEQPYDGKFEIKPHMIEKLHEIGSGEFGTVHKAMYHPPLYQEYQTDSGKLLHIESVIVAVKTVKSTADESYFKALLAELKIMIFIGRHTNIVNLFGACTTNIKERKLDLVVEYCPYKSLDLHLQSRKGLFVNQLDAHRNIVASPEQNNSFISRKLDLLSTGSSSYSCSEMSILESISTEDLIRWSIDTAKGMEYLYAKNVIHGDLAARNVLLTQDKRAKISDFGLSRRIYKYKKRYVTSKQKLLPWRNMAPESLNHHLNFFLESDIWSYGVTMWEFFSLGDMPYSHLDHIDDFVTQLQNGTIKLGIPLYAPSKVYGMMLNCLKIERNERISYREITSTLETILQEFQSPPNNPQGNPSPRVTLQRDKPQHSHQLLSSTSINAAKLLNPSFAEPSGTVKNEFHLHLYPRVDLKESRQADSPKAAGSERIENETSCFFNKNYIPAPGDPDYYV